MKGLSIGIVLTLILTAFLAMAWSPLQEPIDETSIDTHLDSPPAAPKTLAQIRSEAWALEAQIDAVAGRKTGSSGDGSGGSFSAPSEITTSTEWVNQQVSFDLSLGMYINLTGTQTPPVSIIINLWVNNSVLLGNNVSNLLRPTFNQQGLPGFSNFPWTINIYVTNSTIRDFGNFTWPTALNMGGYNTGSTMHIYFDNATVINVSTATTLGYSAGTNCGIQIHLCDSYVESSTFNGCNRFVNSNYCVGMLDGGHPKNGYVYRSRFYVGTQTNGGAIAYFPVAKWNYIDYAYNGIVELQRDFTFVVDGVLPTSGEQVNFSYNYFTRSSHTSIGIGGASWNPANYFQAPMFRSDQYAYMYRNYVNNSYYIQIQTYGNASNLYFVNNYIGNMGPTFSEAFGMNWRTHNVTLDSNYIFDLINTDYYTNGVCCHGIVHGSAFGYNITIKNNILYNIGAAAFWLGGYGLKFLNSTGVERSDYSWRATENILENNYVSGVNYYGLDIDSGYTRWYNNTITNILSSPNVGHAFRFIDGWSPWGLGTQVDWYGGYANFNDIVWGSINADRQNLVWLRTFEGGTLEVSTGNPAFTYPVQYRDGDLTGTWGNTYACIQEQTPETAEYWSQIPCNPMEDAQNFTNLDGSAQWAWRPQLWYNRTQTVTIAAQARIEYTIPTGFAATVMDLTTNSEVPFTEGSIQFDMVPSHNYEVTVSAIGGGGGGPGPGTNAIEGSGLFEVSYPNAGLFDWLTGEQNCQLVKVADKGPKADSYQWNWGDGTIEKTTQSVARHAYTSGIHRLFVTVFDEEQMTTLYYIDISTFGNECSVKLFVTYATFPAMVGSIGFGAIGGLLMLSVKSARNKLGRQFLLVSAIMVGAFFILLSVSGGAIYLPGTQ